MQTRLLRNQLRKNCKTIDDKIYKKPIKFQAELQRPIINNEAERDPSKMFFDYTEEEKLYIGELEIKEFKKKYKNPNDPNNTTKHPKKKTIMMEGLFLDKNSQS